MQHTGEKEENSQGQVDVEVSGTVSDHENSQWRNKHGYDNVNDFGGIHFRKVYGMGYNCQVGPFPLLFPCSESLPAYI